MLLASTLELEQLVRGKVAVAACIFPELVLRGVDFLDPFRRERVQVEKTVPQLAHAHAIDLVEGLNLVVVGLEEISEGSQRILRRKGSLRQGVDGGVERVVCHHHDGVLIGNPHVTHVLVSLEKGGELLYSLGTGQHGRVLQKAMGGNTLEGILSDDPEDPKTDPAHVKNELRRWR